MRIDTNADGHMFINGHRTKSREHFFRNTYYFTDSLIIIQRCVKCGSYNKKSLKCSESNLIIG